MTLIDPPLVAIERAVDRELINRIPPSAAPAVLPRLSPDNQPLFDEAISRPVDQISSLPLPARRIARRFGLPPIRTRLVAELASYPNEANHD